MKNPLASGIGSLAGKLAAKRQPSMSNPGPSPLKYFVMSALCLTILAATTPHVSAQVFNLSSGNSVVSINATSPAGMFNYSVDGVNQVSDQWFWYRAGSMTSESSIDMVGAMTPTQNDARDLTLTYTGAQYTAKVVYSLTGGASGSGQSGLNESITFINTTSSPLTLSFFDYSNFQMGGESTGQTLQFGTSIIPTLHYNSFLQTLGSTSLSTKLTSSVNPTHVEAALFNQTLASLNDNSATTLDDNAGPVSGNVTGTFEWDTSLNAGASLTISSLISVPEPTSTVLFTLGLISCAALYRRGMRRA